MKKYVASSSSQVTLQLSFYPYDRYEQSGRKTVKITAPTQFDALVKMVDNLQLYLTSEDIVEDDMNEYDIISSILSTNGDGCDYIAELKNLTTGETLIEDYDAEEIEEW